MLPFLILVKIDGVVYQIGYRNPEEYRTIRLFREVKDVITKHGCNQDDSTVISAVLPWTENGEKKIITKDSDLYSVFEEFFVRNYPAIEFDVAFKKVEEQNNHGMYLSKLTPLLLKHFKREYPRGRKRKENRGFTIKCSAYNELGSIEKRTRTTQGLVNDDPEVFSRCSGQAGPSSSNINGRQAMGGLQEEPAGCSKDEEDSPWACF